MTAHDSLVPDAAKRWTRSGTKQKKRLLSRVDKIKLLATVQKRAQPKGHFSTPLDILYLPQDTKIVHLLYTPKISKKILIGAGVAAIVYVVFALWNSNFIAPGDNIKCLEAQRKCLQRQEARQRKCLQRRSYEEARQQGYFESDAGYKARADFDCSWGQADLHCSWGQDSWGKNNSNCFPDVDAFKEMCVFGLVFGLIILIGIITYWRWTKLLDRKLMKRFLFFLGLPYVDISTATVNDFLADPTMKLRETFTPSLWIQMLTLVVGGFTILVCLGLVWLTIVDFIFLMVPTWCFSYYVKSSRNHELQVATKQVQCKVMTEMNRRKQKNESELTPESTVRITNDIDHMESDGMVTQSLHRQFPPLHLRQGYKTWQQRQPQLEPPKRQWVNRRTWQSKMKKQLKIEAGIENAQHKMMKRGFFGEITHF